MSEDRQAKIRLTADNADLKKGLDESNKGFTAFQKTITAVKSGLSGLPKQFSETLKAGKQLRDAFTQDVKAMELYQKAGENVGKVNAKLAKGFGQLKSSFGETGKASQDFSKSLGKNVADLKLYQQATEQVQRRTAQLSATIQGLSTQRPTSNVLALAGGLGELDDAAVRVTASTATAATSISTVNTKLAETTGRSIQAGGAMKGFFATMGEGVKGLMVLTDINDKVKIVTTGLVGLTAASTQFIGAFTGGGLERINDTLALMGALGTNPASIQQLFALKDAILGNKQAIIGFGLSAVAATTQFEAALTQVGTVFDGTDEDLDNLGESIREMVNGPLKNLKSSTEALAGQYQVLSGGFKDANQSQQVLSAGLKLSVVGYNDAGSTLELLVKTMKAYGFESNRAMQTAAELNAVVEQGITTIPQLAQVFGATATVASQAGLGIQELGAAVATLTSKGASTPESLTGIEALIRTIVSKTPQAEEALARLSKETGQTLRFDVAELRTKGLVTMLEELRVATKGNISTLREILPDSQAFSTALGLMAENGEAFANAANSLDNATTDSFQQMFEDVAADRSKRFEAVVNRAQELLVEFGQSLTPLFEGGLAAIEKLIAFIDAIPFKGAIAQTMLVYLAVRQLASGVGTLLGTFASVVKQIVIYRATNLLLTGELMNEIKIIRYLVAANKDYLGAFKQLIGLNRQRAETLKDAIRWEGMNRKAQETSTAATKGRLALMSAENAAQATSTTYKTIDVQVVTAQATAETAATASLKAKLLATLGNIKSTAANTAAKIFNTKAAQQQAAATAGSTASTAVNTTALAINTKANFGNAASAKVASNASGLKMLAMKGLAGTAKLVTTAANFAAKALLGFLANPLVLGAIAVLTPALVVLNELFRGSTAELRKASEAMDELVNSSANAENQFSKTAESFKKLKTELDTQDDPERANRFKNFQDDRVAATSSFLQNRGYREDRADKVAKVARLNVSLPEVYGAANAATQNAFDFYWRDNQRQKLQAKEQKIQDTILGYDPSTGALSATGFEADGKVAAGVLPAINRAGRGLGLTDDVTQKIQQGQSIEAEDLAKEKKAYEELKAPIEGYIAAKEQELEKTKDPARRAAIAADISRMNEMADSFKSAYEQQQKFIETQNLVNRTLGTNNAGAGKDFKDAFAAQVDAAKTNLDEVMQQAQDGVLEDIASLENAGLRYGEQIALGFEQGMEGFASPEEAAGRLRELRDTTITKMVEGQEVTQSPFTPAMRRAWTEQIADFEGQASAARIKVIENENSVLERTANLRLANEITTEETIADNRLKASRDQLSTLDKQIAAYKEYGLSTVELEKQAAQLREDVRLQELSNTFKAYENDHKQRMELIEVENRQNQILLAEKTISQEEATRRAAAASIQESRSELQVIQDKIDAAKAAGEDTTQLEKDKARVLDEIRLKELSETERQYQRQLNLRKMAIDNELNAVTQGLKREVDLRINASQEAFRQEKELFESRESLARTQSEQQVNALANQQQLTADGVEKARIGVQLAEARAEQQERALQADRERLVMEGNMNKLALEREKITNQIAQLENQVAIQKLNIELAEARRNKADQEEITALENQLGLLTTQGEVLTQQSSQLDASIEAQGELTANAQAELDVRASMVADNGALSVHEAKLQVMTAQMEQQQQLMAARIRDLEIEATQANLINDARSRTFAMEQSILSVRQSTFESMKGYVEGQYDILIKSETSAKKRRKLEQEAADARLEMLKQSQEFERLSLEMNIKQRDLALERKQIENQTAQLKNKADIESAQAEVERQKALRDSGKATDADVRAAEAGLRGTVAQGAGLAVEGVMLGRESQLSEAQANMERTALNRSQSLQSDQAQMEYIESLPNSARRRRLQREFRNRNAQNQRLANVRGVRAEARNGFEALDALSQSTPDVESLYNQFMGQLGGGSMVAAPGPTAPRSLAGQFQDEVNRRNGGLGEVQVDAEGRPVAQQAPLEIIATNSGIIADLLKSIHVLLGGEGEGQGGRDRAAANPNQGPPQITINIEQHLGDGGTKAMVDDARQMMLEMLRRDAEDLAKAAGGGNG